MKHFVIEFDHDIAKVVSMVQFDTKKEAVDRWIDLKQLLALSSENVEVMMFEAASLDSLKAAAPQYFGAR